MIKPAVTTLLALLCLWLIKANVDTFRPAPPLQEMESTPTKKGPARKMAPSPPLILNPTMRPQLPDLSSGYLFSAERFLAKDARPSKSGKGYGQNIRVEDVVFNGAIIGQGVKKGIVSYSPAPAPTSRTTKTGPQSPSGSRPQTVQLEVGDSLGGYTVKDIAPDFILFVKGSDTITKTLFDPDKKRQQVAPLPTASTPPPQNPAAVAPARRITPQSPRRP